MLKQRQFYRQPEYVFLVLSLIFGLIFWLVIPPFQVPDEPTHFFRAYQITQFDFVAQKPDSHAGGMLPKSLNIFSSVWFDLQFHPEQKATWEKFQESWQISLQPSQKVFLWFSNTALYSPIPYLPQSLGIAIGKIFTAPPLLLLYLGRFFAGIVATGITFWAIARLPFLKWAFVFLSLTPMAIFLRNSLSADSVLIALSFLFVAICLDYAFRDRQQKLTAWNIAELAVLGIAISLCKQVYFPLVFLFFLIPRHKIGSTKRYFAAAGIVILATLIVTLGWSITIENIYAPVRTDVPIDPQKQLNFILENPIQFLSMIWADVWNNIDIYLHHIVGVLGWLDTPLPEILWIPYWLVLLVAAIADNRSQINIHWWQKIGTFLVFLGGVWLIYMSIFMSWTPVGMEDVEGIQGRYFYPFVPLVLLLLVNRRWQLPFSPKKWHLAATFYLLLMLTASVAILSDRYYPI